MYWIWVLIIILLAIIEICTVNLVSVWYIVSGIVSLILSLIIDSFFIEFLVFVLLGTLLLITTRKYLTNLINSNKEKTNLDRVIGMEGIVTSPIDKNIVGEVKVDGKRWSATSNKKIQVDSTVRVLEIDGVKLKVEEVDK